MISDKKDKRETKGETMNKKPKKKLIVFFAVIVMIVCFSLQITALNKKDNKIISAYMSNDEVLQDTEVAEDLLEDEQENEETTEEIIIPKEETVTLAVVGDIMMHIEEVQAAYDRKTKQYSFKYMFEPVKPYIEKADIAIGNLETTLTDGSKGYTGYPRFSSPKQLAFALKYTGFDVITTANNHSLDKNFPGVSYTLDVLDSAGLLHTGTYRTKEESETILIVDKKGIKIAFLAYTYGTNGIPVEKGKEFCINMIDKEKIAADIAKAKHNLADVICVCIHFGNEYHRSPSENQKEMVDFLIQNGADIIIGSHPHVLQPMEMRKVTLDSKEKDVFVIYSMGNFISAQTDRYKDSSIILNMAITKNFETNNIKLHQVEYTPIWVDLSRVNGLYNFRVLPAKKYIDLYEQKMDPLLTAKDISRLKTSYSDTTQMYAGNSKWSSLKN